MTTIVALLITTGLAYGQKTQPAQTPTTKAASVSPEEFNKLNSLQEYPRRPVSREDEIELFRQTRKELFSYGEQLIAKHPQAKNISKVYLILINDANSLYRVAKDKPAGEKLQQYSQALLALKTATYDAKAEADFFLTGMKIRPLGAKPAKDSADKIHAYLKRHKKTAPAISTALAVTLVKMADLSGSMESSLIEAMQKKYSHHERVQEFLISIGKYTGPFQAKTTKLDGTKLNLPDDLLGKVVVIDFWASWCGPCIAELPKMKRIYKAYKSKDVEFVGISLDNSRGALDSFLKTNELPWIHTYDGPFSTNPTSKKYQVQAIPSIWVIDRNGNVFSNNARGRLEETIKQALKIPVKSDK